MKKNYSCLPNKRKSGKQLLENEYNIEADQAKELLLFLSLP